MSSSARNVQNGQARSSLKSGGASRRGMKRTSKRGGNSKTVTEFNRWLAANGKDVGKWARANTKRLTGKETL
ncbi:MAG TPA: hypothetical protein VHM90_11510 [Phycisphaerae bacterium]|jgi:hypothetical protein|nr:hypothetical protein [Phycisphaerae bacterium]